MKRRASNQITTAFAFAAAVAAFGPRPALAHERRLALSQPTSRNELTEKRRLAIRGVAAATLGAEIVWRAGGRRDFLPRPEPFGATREGHAR